MGALAMRRPVRTIAAIGAALALAAAAAWGLAGAASEAASWSDGHRATAGMSDGYDHAGFPDGGL